MFPLYNPSIDYMQAFAAAKRKTNGQFVKAVGRCNVTA
jgi:hypothetical protein